MNAEILQNQEKIKEIKGIGKCANCGADVSPNSAFCNSCGAPIVQAKPVNPTVESAKFCTVCGSPVPAGNLFCVHCGSRIEN